MRWPKSCVRPSTTASVIDLSTPQRQHIAGLVIFLALNIGRTIRAFFPIFIALTVAENTRLAIAAGSIALGVLVVVFTVLEFLRFRYHVEKDNVLVVTRGVIRRERLEIPFSRIQAVHLTRSVLQRLMGLTGVAIDTAGSAESELQIRALRSAEAHALRQLLSPHPSHIAQPEAGSTATRTPAPGSSVLSASPTEAASDRPLFALSSRDLLRIGLTMNHFRNGMIAFGGVVGLGGQVTDLIVGRIEALPAWQVTLFGLLSGLLWFAGIFFFAGLGIFISMLLAWVQFHGLRLTLAGDRLELASGLLKRNEFAILLRKVQILRWRSSWLQRAFGLESLSILQARASSEADEKAVKMVVPGLRPADTQALLAIFTDIDPSSAGFREIRPIPFHLWLMRFAYALPMALPALALLTLAGWTILPLLLLGAGLPFAWHAGRWAHEARMVRTDGHVVWVYEGWWNQTRSFLQPHQLQRISVTQHFLQSRRGSAHLHLHTAAGTSTLRHIDAQTAHALADEFLARVETHRGPWM